MEPETSFIAFIVLALAFVTFLFIVWLKENKFKHRDNEMEVIKGNQAIKMKERELIGKYLDHGELPYNRQYEEMEPKHRRYEELEARR